MTAEGRGSSPSAGQQVFRLLRTEGNTPVRQAAAFGVGAFIGCSPLFGLHLPLSVAAGWLFGLNRVKVYLAANISIPIVAPFLLFAEIQAGHWLRTRRFLPLSLESVRSFSVWHFGVDLVVGSLVVGLAVGAVAAAVTYLVARRGRQTEREAELFQAAADRFLPSGVLAWEFANGKLRKDPVYGDVLRRGLLPSQGTLVDLGCGRGLMLALLAVARERSARGEWPAGWAPAPAGLALHGIELRPRMVESARAALGGQGSVEQGDACTTTLPSCEAVLMIDVLQMIPRHLQEEVLDRVTRALEPGGVFVIREADARGGWRLGIVHASNRMKGILEGDFRRRFYFRSTAQWTEALERRGFAVRTFDEGRSSWLPNLLIAGRR